LDGTWSFRRLKTSMRMSDIIRIEKIDRLGVALASFNCACVSNVDEIASAGQKLRTFVEQNQPRKVIFDFSGVSFFSSQVLGLLIELRARLANLNAEVVVSAIEPQLHRVFRITNLDKIFRFFPDKKSALEDCTAQDQSGEQNRA